MPSAPIPSQKEIQIKHMKDESEKSIDNIGTPD
jgi:hypothetical protein